MTDQAIETTAPQLMLPLDQVFANPDQPRRLFSVTALESLAQSIREYGVIVPIAVVRRDPGYMIIGGERRYRASLLAQMPDIAHTPRGSQGTTPARSSANMHVLLAPSVISPKPREIL